MRHLLACVFLVACGASTGGGNGMDTGEACTGTASRCLGVTYQDCVGGTWHNLENCPDSCTDTLGCVQCDPMGAAPRGCNGNDVVACSADGTFGQVIETCSNGMSCMNGSCSNACTADGVDLVYVVDEANHFMSFDPRKLPGDPFHIIGTLTCPTMGPSIQVPASGVMPFSMSVDRDGKAWVEYSSGEIFNVSLTTAACTPSGYVKQAGGMNLFGMGFVTDAPGSDQEKLYIAGGGHSAEPMGKLAVVDTHAMMYTPQQVGTITAASDYSAELTGTNTAQLYGFFPVTSGGPAYVQEIAKATGAPVGAKMNLGPLGQIRDWAFAQWGGKFYIFTTVVAGSGFTSTVQSIDKMTGTVKTEIASSQYMVDGAGVSTCAPSVIQ